MVAVVAVFVVVAVVAVGALAVIVVVVVVECSLVVESSVELEFAVFETALAFAASSAVHMQIAASSAVHMQIAAVVVKYIDSVQTHFPQSIVPPRGDTSRYCTSSLF